jgi:hypothetical protein
MQRIGRVDRRLNPEVEEKIATLHPDRGVERKPVTIKYWNFLPPDELESLILLYGKVSGKVLTISKLLGIEGGKLLHGDENFDPIQEFNAGYEGQASNRELLQLEYQKLLMEYPELLAQIEASPNGMFSGKLAPINCEPGVFLCYRLPALDAEKNQFTLESGTTKWYFIDDRDQSILEDPAKIAELIRSQIDTLRTNSRSDSELIATRTLVREFIKNSYEKKLDVPMEAPKPKLVCWLEVGRSV